MINESLAQIKSELTTEEFNEISRNLNAYLNNFGYLRITKADAVDSYYVFTDENRYAEGNWTQFCINISYLDGWLYGAVQAVNKIMKPMETKGEN